jgi:hypothetical protein
MLIILSGTRREAYDWVEEKNLNPSQYRIIYDYAEMIHMRSDNNDIQLVGSWNQNERIIEVIDYLMKTDWRHILRKQINER